MRRSEGHATNSSRLYLAKSNQANQSHGPICTAMIQQAKLTPNSVDAHCVVNYIHNFPICVCLNNTT